MCLFTPVKLCVNPVFAQAYNQFANCCKGLLTPVNTLLLKYFFAVNMFAIYLVADGK